MHQASAWIISSAIYAQVFYVGTTIVAVADNAEGAVTSCDTYAANENDLQRKAPGIPFDKIDTSLAIPACTESVSRFPDTVRFEYQLGRAYQKNDDPSKAVEHYQRAADAGYAIAQTVLGIMYLSGRGVTQDSARAVAWLRKAADQGYLFAQVRLGQIFAEGRFAAKDDLQAVAWYRKAADQGDPAAQFALGIMYAQGQGVVGDSEEAVGWFRKAADQGYAAAQFALGLTYAQGQGVPEDDKQAVTWFRKAADQGYPQAKAELARREAVKD